MKPNKGKREYRDMMLAVAERAEDEQDPEEMRVSGYATTFNETVVRRSYLLSHTNRKRTPFPIIRVSIISARAVPPYENNVSRSNRSRRSLSFGRKRTASFRVRRLCTHKSTRSNARPLLSRFLCSDSMRKYSYLRSFSNQFHPTLDKSDLCISRFS